MFELMSALERLRARRGEVVQVVQVVQHPVVQGLQDAPRVVQVVQAAGGEGRDPQNAPVAPALVHPAGRTSAGLAPDAPLAPAPIAECPTMPAAIRRLPWSRLWYFLTPSPLTRTMLECAAERWQEPLDGADLADVAVGKYLTEQGETYLRRYLYQWAAENAMRMQVLENDEASRHENRHISNVLGIEQRCRT